MPRTAPAAEPDDLTSLTYEQAREELVEVVRTLEAGGTTLEQSLALFPQVLAPAAPVLPYALARALVVVAVDVVWVSTLAIAVDRAGAVLRPRVNAWLERVAGGVMVALGTRLAMESS